MRIFLTVTAPYPYSQNESGCLEALTHGIIFKIGWLTSRSVRTLRLLINHKRNNVNLEPPILFAKPEMVNAVEPKLPLSVILVEDYVLLRRELKKIIEEIPEVKVVGEAGDGTELLTLLQQTSPDVVFLDFSLPRRKALEVTQTIRKDYPRVKVIIMVMEEDKEYWTRAVSAGAQGVLFKQDAAAEVPRAVAQLRRGENYLPPQLRAKNSLNDSLGAYPVYY